MIFFFSKSKGDLGHTDLVQHKINTGSAVPIRQSLRRLQYGKRQTEKEEILRMLDWGGGGGGVIVFFGACGLRRRN